MPVRHQPVSHAARTTGSARNACIALVMACVLAPVTVLAAPAGKVSAPEIRRAPATPQAVGVAHTLRTIPEACTRLEGRFTGRAEQPYALQAVRTRPNCQPRAQFVDAAQARPSTASGWLLNDEIRVPNAACSSQHAVVQVWRKPVAVAPPKLDAQGRARLYLQDAQQAAQSDRIAPVPQFAARMSLEGGC